MEKNISLVKAVNKNVRTSPRKLALVCNFIKGKKADVALRDLEFSRKRIAKDVSKTVKSAIYSGVSDQTTLQTTKGFMSFWTSSEISPAGQNLRGGRPGRNRLAECRGSVPRCD